MRHHVNLPPGQASGLQTAERCADRSVRHTTQGRFQGRSRLGSLVPRAALAVSSPAQAPRQRKLAQRPGFFL